MSRIYPTISPYPGAKAGYVGQVIAELLPYDGIDKYYDVFGGMANIILHKRPHHEECYNDLNRKLATLMLVLSDEKLSKELFKRMLSKDEIKHSYTQSGFDYSQFVSNHMIDPNSEFMRMSPYNYNIDTVQLAAEVWRTLLFSINGSMKKFRGVRTGTEVLTFENQMVKKFSITERLKNVSILNVNAFELIDLVKDDTTALMVCDSPYTKKQMGAKVIYECEFSEEDQYRYVNLLYDCKAKCLVCGYNNEIYNSVLLTLNGVHKWYKYEIAEVVKSMSISGLGVPKKPVTEVIWTNWKIH